MKYLLLLSIFLTACAASEAPPAYLMRLGSSYAWRCGGYAIDPHHIITAAHCGWLTKAQTNEGVTVNVELMAEWPEIDTALYQTDGYLGLDSYAALRPMEPSEPAYAFGYCPLWDSTAARFAQYVGTETEPLYCHELHLAGAWICSGDSGGVIEQGGAVVGMIAQFRGNPLASNNGRTFAHATCAVPGEAIARRVEKWRRER